MPNHRNTGLLGIIQNYNDTMSQLEAQREGGFEGLLGERNRLAVRDAQLDTADHLAALREQQERAERRAHLEHQRQERERERIAALPKCTDCESPVEGAPNRCPRCNEIGIMAASQFHAAPQLRQWLSNPAKWPVLRHIGVTADDINTIRREATTLITQLRSTREYQNAPNIRHSRAIHTFIEKKASEIDAVESSTQDVTAKKRSTFERQFVDSHPYDDTIITKHVAICGLLLAVAYFTTRYYEWIGIVCLSGGVIGMLMALVGWNARVQDHKDALAREYQSKLDAEIAELQNKRARLMAGLPGVCFRLRELTREAQHKSQLNDGLRGQWVRICESTGSALPPHMVGNSTGPSPIAGPLAEFFSLFHAETRLSPRVETGNERSTATSDAKDAVIYLLARSLIAVAAADGKIQSNELTAVTKALIGIGAEEDLARASVKECMSELKAGSSPLAFIKSTIALASKFKGTPFGQNVLEFQRAVAESDGGVSVNESKVLKAFESELC